MEKSNNTRLSYVLKSIIPMMETFGVGLFSANSVWSMVLGVLPQNEGDREEQIMKINREDKTEDKVDNINTITGLARLMTKRPDYAISNLTDFTYAIRQLDRYAFGDEIANSSLSDLKDIYISFITAYFHQSMTFCKQNEAFETLKYFSEDILQEDKEIATRLAKISSYHMLS